MQSNQEPTSIPAFVSVFAFGALSLLGGWIVVHGDGFYAANSKYSSSATFVAGMPAVFMALLQFLAAALAFTWVLRRYLSPVPSFLAGFGLTFMPPLLFLLR
ncbi:hypothetical protein [Hydrogenophaga sp. 5NK40-0174]|uniref:hypothetical protein n=1 Tax=Hydrogenophaga sp. 5NK40-0174 TaxID=3127649 RepID=UPI003103BCF8